MSGRHFVATVILLVVPCLPLVSVAQLPLSPDSAAGQTVTPVFEGWYINPDGSRSIVFGYYNRNLEEVIDIPVGPDNFMSPGPENQGQPTHFEPRRHWGVFAVNVPADFGSERVVWTLTIRGESFAIPGSLKRDWQIDALVGEAGSGNTPPVLRFGANGKQAAGPAGVTAVGQQAKAGIPVALAVWASDDGKHSGSVAASGKEGEPVSLTWIKHQGPGDVVFSEMTSEVGYEGGDAMTMATFSKAGTYVVRVRANDASGVAGAGHAQCCWTNGFVKVNVSEQEYSGERND